MSYDGYIYLPVAPKPTPPADLEPAEVWRWWDAQPAHEVLLAEVGNYTSNVSGMWRAALEATSADVEDVPHREDDGAVLLSATDGWPCSKAAPTLTAAAAWMREHGDELRELNPGNGWGDYEGAVAYMETAAELTTRYASVRSDHGVAYLHWSY